MGDGMGRGSRTGGFDTAYGLLTQRAGVSPAASQDLRAAAVGQYPRAERGGGGQGWGVRLPSFRLRQRSGRDRRDRGVAGVVWGVVVAALLGGLAVLGGLGGGPGVGDAVGAGYAETVSTVLRVLAHGVIAPAWLLLALAEWNRGRRRLPILFVLFSVERYTVLAGLAFDLAWPGSWMMGRGVLTPVVLVEAGVMVWLVWAWLKKEE